MSRFAILLYVFLTAFWAGQAYAYLDPGSGNFILQAIVTALIGSALAIKVYWQRLRAFLSRFFSRSAPAEEGKD